MLLAAGALCFASAAPAQNAQAKDSEVHFQIRRFEVTGNTLLPSAEVEQTLAPFTGPQTSFSDVRRAADALEAAFRQRGYGVVRVDVPEQDVTSGVVRLQVVERRVGKVTVEGNTHFDEANIRRSLPSVKEGEVPNANDIARNLEMAAEHPVKQTAVLLRAGAEGDVVDVGVRVADDKPWRAFFTLDNTGTSETGYYRSGFGYQHSNLFDRDHTLTAQYVTSPTRPSDVTIFGAGYRIPFYDLNSSLDLTAGYSDVNSGTVQGLFTVSGSGTLFGARWNWYLPRLSELEQKLSLALDYRAFHNNVQFQGQGLVPDVTVHPLTATYGAVHRAAAGEVSFYAAVSHDLPGGNDGGAADFSASRAGATDRYTLERYGLNAVAQLPRDWQARAAFTGQYTNDALVAGEQFGAGGPDSVRGYLLREIAADRGYSAQLELYTPDFAAAAGLHRLRMLAFLDGGSVQRNLVAAGESSGASISSAGVGARWSYGKRASLRLDLARIMHSSLDRLRGSSRLGAALVLTY